MYSLTLEITKRCNLNCSYCYVENKEKVNMKWKTAQLAIDIAMREAIKQKDKTLSVYFIGGEPLLAFGLLKEIIFYIEKKNEQIGLNIFYSTTTNGTVFTTEIIEFMIEKRVRFKISIDGLEDVHNENRKFVNGVGSYSEVKEKLVYKEEFEKMTGIAVHAAQLINTNTYTKFSASFRHLHELGFRYIETEINAYQKWNKEDKICLFQQIDEAFEYYISSRNRGQLWVWKFYNDMLEGFVADYLPFFPCKAGLVSLFVTVKGELYPCIETGKKYMIGSVDKGLDAEYIRKIIKIEKTQNTRCLQCKEYKENKCRICSCLFGNYENTGNCYIPSEINCELTRHVNNIFREKYSEEQVAMLRKHYVDGNFRWQYKDFVACL